MKKRLFVSVFLFFIVTICFAQTDFSGTFVNPNGRLGLMFTENTVLIHGDGNPMGPPLDFNISGNSIRTRLSQAVFNWTIIDSNTIRDNDGENYTRVTSLSGTFRYGSGYSITFTDNNFSLQWGSNSYTGNYTISGVNLILNRADGVNWHWFIVSRDIIRDQDGDSWRK